MKNYVYVTKKEYLSVREQLFDLIKMVQDEVRNEFTFSFKIIGSAARNMITCDFGTNVGFDFDVNLYVNDDDQNYTASEIRQIIKRGFDKHSCKFNYDYVEDSKRVLTIKVKDRDKSKILHSCDFAVVYDDKDEGTQQYIHFNKKQNTYEWQFQPNGFYQIEERIQYLKEYNLWQEVRYDYLRRKNSNTVLHKKSRSLFAETINNLYHKY